MLCGFKEEGPTSTPFDMVVMNDLDYFHLVADVIDRVPSLGYCTAYDKQAIQDTLIEHKQYIARHGQDPPELRNWKWKTINQKWKTYDATEHTNQPSHRSKIPPTRGTGVGKLPT